MIRNARRIGFVQTTSAFSDVIIAMKTVVRRRHTVARRQGNVKNAMGMYIVNGGKNVLGICAQRGRIMRSANQETRSMVKDAEMEYGSIWTAKAQRIV